MSNNNPPIVVTGGSVTIDFDAAVIPKIQDGKHHHSKKRITRVEVLDGKGNSLYNLDTPHGKVKVVIHIDD